MSFSDLIRYSVWQSPSMSLQMTSFCSFFMAGVTFLCIYVQHLYSFVCQWTFRLLPLFFFFVLNSKQLVLWSLAEVLPEYLRICPFFIHKDLFSDLCARPWAGCWGYTVIMTQIRPHTADGSEKCQVNRPWQWVGWVVTARRESSGAGEVVLEQGLSAGAPSRTDTLPRPDHVLCLLLFVEEH